MQTVSIPVKAPGGGGALPLERGGDAHQPPKGDQPKYNDVLPRKP